MITRRRFLRGVGFVVAFPGAVLLSHKPNHGGTLTGHARVTWAAFQTPAAQGGGGAVPILDHNGQSILDHNGQQILGLAA